MSYKLVAMQELLAQPLPMSTASIPTAQPLRV
ncbi:hypothetical protein QN277_022786 [Acacia crassicarpa]|uniref:Uncharacterized protein n=1 Tax=Acacia crassicarpa TaxID=499986 RepID=A0AAE1JJQ1_9FABA|nr:hypothetical protein QN277_022786 [Acacia crassicarpa]